MKRMKHYAEYLLVRVFDVLFLSLPAGAALLCGEALGLLLSRLLPGRRTLIRANLSKAFPELAPDAVRRIEKGVWKNIGRTAVEFIRVPLFARAGAERFVEWEGVEHLERALAQGTGAILLTSHFTNWELTGMFIAQRFENRLTAIARPMKNSFVERWVQNKRATGGVQIILHRQAVRASLKWLKRGNFLGALVDQNLYTGGVFVDFFGRPAATTTLPILLHVRTGAPVIQVYTLRTKKGFRLVVEPPVAFPSVSEGDPVVAWTAELNHHLERVIRRYPENWFWIHNRWKRRPEPAAVFTEEQKGAA